MTESLLSFVTGEVADFLRDPFARKAMLWVSVACAIAGVVGLCWIGVR